MRAFRTIFMIGCSMLMTMGSALAQKSADTIRIAINNSFPLLSPAHFSLDEATFFSQKVYESLISYNEYDRTWVPRLAKSWTRLSPTAIEFELRDDVVFHNGNKFDADDIIATFGHLLDPNVKLRYKYWYNWVDNIEKLGPYKIRINTKVPTPTDLGLLAYRFVAFDGETMKGLADPADYGRLTPIGTGPYKVTQMDSTKGISVERFDGYSGDKTFGRSPAKRVQGLFIGERQTQIAQLLAGGVDAISNVIQDQADALKSKPGFDITYMPGISVIYFQLDSSGRSGVKALTDERVRRAIFMSIDRDAIINGIVPGGQIAEKSDVPCLKSTIGCEYTVKQPPYDPAGARQLLAEAGYGKGFDLEYTVYAPIKDIGVAISGYLQKVGINATINAAPFNVYLDKLTDGKMQAFSIYFPIGNFPDASNLTYFFEGVVAKYFNEDPVLMNSFADGNKEMDPAKRNEFYRTAFNRLNDIHFILPISSLPTVYAHSNEIKVSPNPLIAARQDIGDLSFK